ncbi:MAG: methyltransferase [Rhizobiales bacterium]|nr:methyltransferase [Hyphomicrobiales bacterium]
MSPPLSDEIIAATVAGHGELVPEVVLRLAAHDEAFETFRARAGRAGVGVPYWARAWPGGQALARLVLDRPELVAGRTVVDVGAGSGLAAIAACLAGADDVTAVDRDPFAGLACDINAAANGVSLTRRTADLCDLDVAAGSVLLAGDLWYDRLEALRVTAWLRHRARSGVVVLCGDCRRSHFPRESMVALASYEIAGDEAFERGGRIACGVWSMS